MPMTEAEKKVLEVRSRYADASLACEGIYLTDEEKRLFAEMDAAGLTHDERRARINVYLDAVHAPQPIAAE